MQIVKDLLNSHPKRIADLDVNAVVDCIAACYECEVACNSCADACLSEDNVQMLLQCIRLNQDCANICAATGHVLSRQTESSMRLIAAQVDAMELACRLCAEECEKHAQIHEHCRVCAQACRRCERACRHIMEALSATTS